jgi:hypothetical protein
MCRGAWYGTVTSPDDPVPPSLIDDKALRNLYPKTIEHFVERVSGFARSIKNMQGHLAADRYSSQVSGSSHYYLVRRTGPSGIVHLYRAGNGPHI